MLVWKVTLHPCAPKLVGMDPRGGPGLVLKRGDQRIMYAATVGGLGVHPVPAIFANQISAILADCDLSSSANRDLSSLNNRTSMILANQHLTIFLDLYSANFASLFCRF